MVMLGSVGEFYWVRGLQVPRSVLCLKDEADLVRLSR